MGTHKANARAARKWEAAEQLLLAKFKAGQLDSDLYEKFVHIGIRDVREKLVEDDSPTLPVQQEDPASSRPLQEETVELSPLHDDKVAGDVTSPTRDRYRAPGESVDVPLIDDGARETFTTEPTSEPVRREDGVVAATESARAEAMQGQATSHLFYMCTKRLRLDWSWSNERNLPREIAPKAEVSDAIVLHHCGQNKNGVSKASKEIVGHESRGRGLFGESASEPVATTMEINPKIWRGSDVYKVVRIIAGRDVEVLADTNGIVSYVDALDMHSILGPEDGVNSLHLDRYLTGERRRDNLVRGYLAGGLGQLCTRR